MAVAAKPASGVAREAWTLLFQLAKAKHTLLTANLAALDLTNVQAHALHLLEPERPLAMSALADALYCHASNVTRSAESSRVSAAWERRKRTQASSLAVSGTVGVLMLGL